MLSTTQVLVVASEPKVLSHVSSSFEGCQITTVANADDAIEKLGTGLSPNLVFLELCPAAVCNGLHTLVRLKQTYPYIKVIAISDSDDTRQAVEAMRLGAQECLVKPFTKSEFEAVVDRCLGPVQ